MIHRREALKTIAACAAATALPLSLKAESHDLPKAWIPVGKLCDEDIVVPTWDDSPEGIEAAKAVLIEEFKAEFEVDWEEYFRCYSVSIYAGTASGVPPKDLIFVGVLCGHWVLIPCWDTSPDGVASAMALFMDHFKAVFFTVEER